jgi:hypothetical protein
MHLKKERKKIVKSIPSVLFLWVIAVGISAPLTGITIGNSNGNWYNPNLVFLHLKIHIVFFAITITGVIYRYKTGFMPAPIAFLFANAFAVFFGGSLPDWRWLIVLAAMYPVVTIMPFVNQGISSFLHKELFAPKTKIGKALLWGLPAMGITGATLSQMARNFGNGLIGFAVIGLIFHLLLVWQTASFAQQMWKQWQKEKENKAGAENA